MPHNMAEKMIINQQSTNSDNVQDVMSDMGAWPEYKSQSFRDLMVNASTECLRNTNGPFSPDESGRSLT